MRNQFCIRKLASVIFAISLAASFSVQAFAAGVQDGLRPAAAAVTGVRLNHTQKTLKEGRSFILKATIAPAGATNKKVRWKSSPKKVATVHPKKKGAHAVVRAHKKGKATITCITQSGEKKASCKVTVGTPVTRVKLNATKKTLKVGSSATLKATLSPARASNKDVAWSSSKPAVATISPKGSGAKATVNAKSPGSAVVTAKAKDGSSKKATCKVTVSPISVTSVNLDVTTANLTVGNTLQLSATVTPHNATQKTVIWSSSVPAVASVNSSGGVTALAPGTTTITARTADGGKLTSCHVTVAKVAIPVTGVSLSPDSATLGIGESVSLNAALSPSSATNRALIFNSSDGAIASVDSSGKVTALAAGRATITVTTADGGKTAAASILVDQNITDETIAIEAPATGHAPQTTIAETASYTASIAWNGNPAVFEADTSYTATLTLTAKEGCRFTQSTNVLVPGTLSVIPSDVTNTRLVLTATFAPTSDKIAIIGFQPFGSRTLGPAGENQAQTFEELLDYLTLPLIATALLPDGKTLPLSIADWLDTDSFDGSTPGTYTLTAVLNPLPEEYVNSGGHTVIFTIILT